MKKSITFAGLDVHKNSIAAAEGGRNGKVRNYGVSGGEIADLLRLVKQLSSPGKELHFWL